MSNLYFTVHSVQKMEQTEFSIWIANIDNTPDNLEKAKSLFPEPHWWIEFHIVKYDMKWSN